jgi:hypothetical protein
MQCLPVPSLNPLMFKQSPQRPAVRHPQSVFSFDETGPVSQPHETEGKIIVVYTFNMCALHSRQEGRSLLHGSKVTANLNRC